MRLVGEECPHLTDIRLDSCYEVGDQAIISLAEGCPQITNLSLKRCPGMTDKAMIAIGENLALLIHLNVSTNGRVTSAGVRAVVSQCGALKWLQIDDLQRVDHACREWARQGWPEVRARGIGGGGLKHKC